MSKPRILKDIDVLLDLIGVDGSNLETLINNNGNPMVCILQSLYDLRDNINELSSKLGGVLKTTILSSLNVGDTFYLMESGLPTPFILAHKEYLGKENNVIAVRKYALAPRQFHNNTNSSSYEDTDIDDFLENTYTSLLTEVIFSPLAIPVCNNLNGNLSTSKNRRAFLGSYTEYTGSKNPKWNKDEGYILNYFSGPVTNRVIISNDKIIQPASRSMMGPEQFIQISTQIDEAYYIIATGLANPRPFISLDNSTSVYTIDEIVANTLATSELSAASV